MAYKHTNSKGVTYYLHKTEVTLRGGKPQTIYFFAKVEKNAKGTPVDLPEDRVVKENPRNGFLTVSKKKQFNSMYSYQGPPPKGWALLVGMFSVDN